MTCGNCGYRINRSSGTRPGGAWVHIDGPEPRGPFCVAGPDGEFDPDWFSSGRNNEAEPEQCQARLI